MKSQMLTIVTTLILLGTTACSTLNESVQLGATMGAVTGAAATHSAYNELGVKPDSARVTTGAAIGLAVGILTSYITHKEVEKERYTPTDSPETYFGDLPPNPFFVPMTNKRGGN